MARSWLAEGRHAGSTWQKRGQGEWPAGQVLRCLQLRPAIWHGSNSYAPLGWHQLWFLPKHLSSTQAAPSRTLACSPCLHCPQLTRPLPRPTPTCRHDSSISMSCGEKCGKRRRSGSVSSGRGSAMRLYLHQGRGGEQQVRSCRPAGRTCLPMPCSITTAALHHDKGCQLLCCASALAMPLLQLS